MRYGKMKEGISRIAKDAASAARCEYRDSEEALRTVEGAIAKFWNDAYNLICEEERKERRRKR